MPAKRRMKVISITMPPVMLNIIDDLIDQGTYRDRSIAIRSLLIRGLNELLRERVQEDS